MIDDPHQCIYAAALTILHLTPPRAKPLCAQSKYSFHAPSTRAVYYANYLKYMEEARTACLTEKGISIKDLHNEGFMYAVRKCNLNYKQPARYGDEIECNAVITKVTAAQIFFDQKICDKKSGETLVEGEMVLVSLDKNFNAAPIPDNIRSILSK